MKDGFSFAALALGQEWNFSDLKWSFPPLHIGIDLRYGDYVLSDYDIVSYDECAVAGGVRTVGHLSLAEWHTSLAVRAGMAIARSSIARSSVARGKE